MLCKRYVLLRFYTAADGDNDLALSQIDRCLRFLKRLFGGHPDIAHIHFHRLNGRASLRGVVTTKCTGLEGDKVRSVASDRYVGVQLPEKNASGQDKLPILVPIAYAVARHFPAEPRGNLRCKIADLVRV